MDKTKYILEMVILLIFLFIPTICYGHDIDSNDIVDKIEMNVNINEDGSAFFSEKWYVLSSGRVGYIKNFNGLVPEQIVNLKITDENGKQLEYVDNKNENIDQNNIKNKCGVIKGDGGSAQIYWGVEDNGTHVYEISYQANNFIKEYDYMNVKKGIGFKFLDEAYLCPIALTIKTQDYVFTPENTTIIGFNEDRLIKKYLDDGSLYLAFSVYNFTGYEALSFSEDAPFRVTPYQKQEDKILKKQDIIVLSIIVVLSALYLFADIYRTIYEYKIKRKKFVTN